MSSSGTLRSQKKESVVADDQVDVLINVEEEEDQMMMTGVDHQVTSHLYLKPTHSSGPLDKQVVLRRIRHRKRVNQVRSALQSFLAPSSKSAQKNRWVDDPFAAP